PSLRRNHFRTILRRMPRVPEASPEATFRKPFETPPSDSPSEHATCPGNRPERPFGPSFGECHMSPNTPSRENPFGCRPSSPPVPSAEAETISPPDAVRERHASRSPHRDPNRETPRPPSGCFLKE